MLVDLREGSRKWCLLHMGCQRKQRKFYDFVSSYILFRRREEQNKAKVKVGKELAITHRGRIGDIWSFFGSLDNVYSLVCFQTGLRNGLAFFLLLFF